MARRQYGTGSVSQRASDGRWIGTIEAGWTAKGTRRRLYVSGKTEAEAKRKLKQRQREVATKGTQATSRTTVKAWAEQWLAITAASVRPATHTADRSAVAAWIVPTIGHRRLDQLHPGDVRAVATAVRDAGHPTSTARRYHGTLVRLLKAAIQEGHDVPTNVLSVKPPPEGHSDRQALTVSEALAVLEAASHLPHGSRWAAALLLGMRQGECLGLGWDSVDEAVLRISWQLQSLRHNRRYDPDSGFRVPDGYEARHLEGTWHLVRPKSGAGRRQVPLVSPLAEALAGWRMSGPASPHGLVWPAVDGKPVAARADRDEWHDLQDAAGVRHPSGRYYHVHEARNTTATLLMELRVPESVRIAILGHTSIITSMKYETVAAEQARTALEGVASRLAVSEAD